MATNTVELLPQVLPKGVEELMRQLQKVAAESTALSLQDKLNKARNSAESARQEINEKAKDAPKDGQIRVLDSKADIDNLSPKIKEAQVYVKAALREIKDNPKVLDTIQSPQGLEVVKILARHISEDSVTQSTSPYIFKILDKAVHGQVQNPLDVLTGEDLKVLKAIDPLMHSIVVGIFADSADRQGIATADVDKFRLTVEPEVINIDSSLRGRVEATRDDGLPEGFRSYDVLALKKFYSDADLKTVYAIIDHERPEKFLDLVLQAQTEIVDAHRGKSPEFIGKLVSEQMEKKITLMFAKLFSNTDTKPATEPFEKLIEVGYNDSIRSTYERMWNSFGLLMQRFEAIEHSRSVGGVVTPEEQKIHDSLKNLKMYKRESFERVEEATVGDNRERKKIVVPTAGLTESKMSGFLSSVYNMVNVEQETKAFLHNMSVIFRRPAGGEGGFWGGLAKYAEQLTGVDYDTLNLLPDSHIFMTAYRLYSKYLEEEFARFNWIHQPGMFANTLLSTKSKIEQQVEADLKDQFREEVGDQDWRIRRAMTYGIGIARGVMLNEPEIAAWADPDVNPNDPQVPGKFRSYYTNDNAALTAFNPMHHFFRWQNDEMILGPLLFTKVKGIKRNLFFHWDHREEWEDVRKFRESFSKGKLYGDDTKLFIDMLPNIARVGSLQTRGGWRMEDAYNGWLQYKGTKRKDIRTEEIDYLPSWQAIENIGFEVLLDFANNKLGKDSQFFNKPSDERRAFFHYLYKQYINPKSTNIDTDFENEVKRTDESAKHAIEDKIKHHEIDHPSDDKKKELVEEELYKQILYKALFGVVKNRMPTKFIRIDRRRFTKGHQSAWESMRENSFNGWTQDQFDGAMKDIAKVETIARQAVSGEMRDHMRDEKEPTLLKFKPKESYVVDEVRIKKELTKLYASDPDRIKRATDLYTAISKKYLDYNTPEAKEYMDVFADKIRNRNKHFPFALATEELDTTFLAYRTAGLSVLRRAISDIGVAEKDVHGNLIALVSALHHAAVSPKDGDAKIVESIKKIKLAIEGLHGHYAVDVAQELGNLAMAFFTKDTDASNIFTKWGRIGVENSLAAEFLGGSGRVGWEWGTAERDQFINHLGKEHVVPFEPYDHNKGPIYEKVANELKIPLTKIKIPLGTKLVKRKPDPGIHNISREMRADWGATHGNIAWDMVSKYLPILMMFLLWKFISQALSEVQGGKSGGGGGH